MIGARVYLWGTEIGAVTQEDASSLPRFQYTRAFQRSGIEPSPLMMPVTNRIYAFPANQNDAFLGLPGLLADSLPDKFGNRLIQAYLARIGRTMRELSAVERLCYTGSRSMGALEYVPAHEFVSNTSESVQIDELVKLASDILSERKEWYINTNEHGLEQLMRIGTSAGGARAKALIAWNPVTGDIRSGQIDAGAGYEYWLIKFDGVENNRDKEDSADKPSYTRIEYAYYLMAQHARITMSKCRLHRDNGLYHFMTQRFDRANGGGKIHMQTLGALAHYNFNDPAAHGYEDAAEIMRRIQVDQADVNQLFLRMVFCVLLRNQDDHVKNISFLMDRDGTWRLAPAYDMTYSYAPGHRWIGAHQMTIQGKTRDITLEDLKAAGKAMNVSSSAVRKSIDLVRHAQQQWAECAARAEVPETEIDRIKNGFIYL